MQKKWYLKALASALLPVYAQSGYAEDSTKLEQVLVSASTIEDRFESDRNDPASSTVILAEDIDAKHATNIIEVLRAIPGVTADLAGEGDGIKIKIRGVDNQRYMGEKPGVAIVIDGVPVFERTGKVNIDLDNIQSIRVVKGAASFLYGEDALSGAVIISTKRGVEHEGVTVEYDRGAYGYDRKLIKGGFAGEAFAGHIQYADRHNDGYYAFSRRDSETLSGNFQYYLDENSDLTFGFEKTDRFRDRDGSVRGVTAAETDPEGELAGRGYTRMFQVDLSRLNLTYSNDFSDSGNLLAVVYQYQDITDFWSAPVKYDASGNRVGDDQVDMYQNLNDYEQVQRGIKLEARDSFGSWGLMVGTELKKNTFDEVTTVKEDYRSFSRGATISAGTIKSDAYREEITRAVYAETKKALSDRLTVTMNYRFDNLFLDGLDRLTDQTQDDEFSIHSWRIGGDYDVTPVTSLYGGVATGFRAPTLSELSGNPDLIPEKTLNYEIGIRSALDLFGWKTKVNSSIFYIERKDFITSAIGQYVNGAAATNTNLEDRSENVGHTVSQGLELALQTEKKYNVSFDFAYTLLDSHFVRYDNFFLALGNPYARTVVTSESALTDPANQVYFKHFDNAGNAVPRTPTHSANFRINWYPSAKLRLLTEIDYRGESYADEINQEIMPARTLVNLGLEYQTRARIFSSTASDLGVFVKVDNVLDDQFYSIVRAFYDSDQNGVYNEEDLSINVDPGRVWMAGVKVKF
ncbi:TonB-dependent receptor [Thiomicrorhabdus sp.]|uniref:TonB-dependent receptor n=1 Tax=Thiomicrorhabdus sp. TaxID=2039724 RepID=UPI0029C6643B|nr:TonB-dependent receptor [Thiomicrorhabdus sp.]